MATPFLTGAIADLAQGVGVGIVHGVAVERFELLAERFAHGQIVFTQLLARFAVIPQAQLDGVRGGAEGLAGIAAGGCIAQLAPLLNQLLVLAVALLIADVIALAQGGDGLEQLLALGCRDEVLPVTEFRDTRAQLAQACLAGIVELAFGAIAQ